MNDSIIEKSPRSHNMRMEPTEEFQKTGNERLCPLCTIPGKEVLMEFPRWRLTRTKTMKGHRERLMIYYRDHVRTLDEQSVGEAYMLLLTIGRKFFSYTKQWGIFEPVYATVPDHWHRVASDLDPGSEDYEQILKTPRLIIDTDQMTIDKVKPEPQERLPETTPSATPLGTSGSQLQLRSSSLTDTSAAWKGLHDTK